jgi:cytochrome c oxidase assembly protein subunit 15
MSQRLARQGLRNPARVLAVALVAQVALGIANVRLGLPLAVALAHVAVAVLLLGVLVYSLARTQPRVTIAG